MIITVYSDSPPIVARMLLGDGSAISSGYGGWEEVQRPRRTSLTEWTGQPPLRVVVPVLVEGWASKSSTYVESTCRALERMAGVGPGDEPPLVKFHAGGAVPHDVTRSKTRDWVIEELEWGDDGLRDARGRRVRAPATITFLEYTQDERLARLSPAKRRKKRGKGKGKGKSSKKRYTVKRGDSLTSIAARLLGSAKRWKEIAKLNHIRDPKKIRPGQVLKIP